MSAHDHLNPGQLAMFMPARQIINDFNLADAPGGPPDTGMQSPSHKNATIIKKRQENTGRSRSAAMAHGIQSPVEIWHGDSEVPFLSDGHHRLVGAFDKHPNTEVPIVHTDWQNPHRGT